LSFLIPAVNHGVGLAPKDSWGTKAPKTKRCGNWFDGKPIEGEDNLEEIERQLKFVSDKKIEIWTCPTVNVRSQKIERYEHHPFHWWLQMDKMNIQASIHVDDFYWTDMGTTLSDEIAKMMLAAPGKKKSKDKILTPKLAVDIHCV